MSDSFNSTSVPEFLSPAAIAEYINRGQCERFAKHRLQEIQRTRAHTSGEFDEAFAPLNILFAAAGEEFEAGVTETESEYTRETIDCTTDSESFVSDHETLRDWTQAAIAADLPWDDQPVMLYQVSLSGSLQRQGIRGDADHIFIWSTESGARIRVIDAKRTDEQKVYHQVQAAAYAAIIQQLLEQSSEIEHEAVTVSAGVITQSTSIVPPTHEVLPKFDLEPRIADLHRLLADGSDLMQTLQTDFGDAAFQFDGNCGTCPYNEACVTESYENADIRLLGLTTSQQQILRDHGIGTIADVAALLRTPDPGAWTPKSHHEGTMPTPLYQELRRTPTIGELLPQLVYRAQGMLDSLVADPTGPSDRPRNWLPASGPCDLPDDEPPTDAPGDHTFQAGSMIRVYLNVQYDHLRNRIIQLSARVSATASDVSAQRRSVLSDRAPKQTDQAASVERDLLERFVRDLFDAIQTVGDSIEFSSGGQEAPLLHFYLYTDGERQTLFEAFDRHDESDLVRAFRSTVEGVDRPDDAMVSTLRSEVENHIILETPSAGLIHVYRELYPPADAYAKSRSTDAWSYSPPDRDQSYDLRRVFARRLFETGVQVDAPDTSLGALTRAATPGQQDNSEDHASGDDIGLSVAPDTADWFDGLNTRVRTDASIPLAYLWVAVDRINDEWADHASVADSALAQFELQKYRYRIGEESGAITPTDVRTLGRHVCDMLEHVERSLTYKDARLTKAPYPLDELSVDTLPQPTLAEGAEQYLLEEYRASRTETYDLYRQFPLQRLLSGKSVAVYVTDVTERTSTTLAVSGRLRYDEHTLFGDQAETVKRACQVKGADGSSSGSWMVANKFQPTSVHTAVTEPYNLEQGVNATVERIDTDAGAIRLTLQNFWHEGGDFGQHHDKWTTDSDRRADDDWLVIEPGDWLILDPQTDDIAAERAQRGLQHAETNALHALLEQLRRGQLNRPETSTFTLASSDTEIDGVTAITQWLAEAIDPDTFPSDRQQEFITDAQSQILALQGPPGTGKTAATMAPALLARLYAGARAGTSVNGLVTAPSNTAIDEVLSDTAELVAQAETNGPVAAADLDIELVRIGPEPLDPIDGVTYVDYNDDDHADRLERVIERLRIEGATPDGRDSPSQDSVYDSQLEMAGSQQSGLSSFIPEDGSASKRPGTDRTNSSQPWTTDRPLTLVFTTATRSWRFLREVAPTSNPDDEEIAAQQLWHLLAVDEASMLELPNLLLAGAAFDADGQLLVGGDHRQLPPVHKRDWDEVYRRDIRTTAAYVSTLDYIRLLRGDAVLDSDEQARVGTQTPFSAALPLVQLDTTYRFGEWTAEFIRQTVYEQDGIEYSSARSPDAIQPDIDERQAPLAPLFADDTDVALLTYTPARAYQQWNPIESRISEALVMATGEEADIGMVTPHNAQRGRIKSHLTERGYDVGVDADGRRSVQVETVNRFQGGEQNLMIVNATVSDRTYIAAEDEFLLTENRINVSFTRHRDLLVVLAPETLLGYLPEDPDLYDEASLWKELALELGAAPSLENSDPDWQGHLGELLAAVEMQSVDSPTRTELPTIIKLYTN